jgi:chloramphenicol O-acetyltransferase type A
LKRELDIHSWNRKDHYNFFRNFDNPFYNICTKLEITELYKYCKEKNTSFFLASLYLSIRAVNKIEEFRNRIENDKVFTYDRIHPSSTVLNDDNTFSFCEFDYVDSFSDFVRDGKASIKRTVKAKRLIPNAERKDVIHYTTIPWIELTGLTHARNYNTSDSIPKIVFGKYYKEGNKYFIPFCVEVHHGLVDGFHIGKLLEIFRASIVDCESLLNS